jgi:fructose-1,6-bisphosphatase/inositol monophosphatase family enzyme
MGGADLLVDFGIKPWDWGALVPIVEEAGGVVRDWHGQTLTLQSNGDVVCASSRAVADAALAVLGRTR